MPGLLLLLITAAVLVLLVLTIVVAYDATHPVRRTGAYAAVRGLPFDPGDLGLPFESWTLERPGAKLAVWEVGWASPTIDAPSDKGASVGDAHPTVVLIHGWGESRIDMLKDIEFWKERADRAVLYDLRGHGESSGTSRLGNGEDDDLLALLERVGADRRFLLVGRDLGANIAIAAAMKASDMRERIVGIIASSPYRDFHARMAQRLKRREFPARPMTDLAMVWFALTGRKPLEVHDDAAAHGSCPMLRLEEWDQAAVDTFIAERSAARRG